MRLRTMLPVAFLMCSLASREARSQPTQAEIEASKKAAADFANKAFDAFKDGKYGDAIAGFEKAEQKFHAPKFLLYIARSHVKQGKLVAAKGVYDTIVKEQLPAYAPAEFFKAQTEAKAELASLLPRIPTLQIQARNGVSSAEVDGHPVATGQTLSVDPGAHTVVGKGAAIAGVSIGVVLKEGETKTVVLEPPHGSPKSTAAAVTSTAPQLPTASPAATVVATTEQATTAAPSTEPASPRRGPPTLTWASYGVGAVGLVAGAVFGGLTLAKHDEFDAKPTREALDQGRTFGLVTDIAFGTAVVGAAVGTIYWLVSRPKSEPLPPRTGIFIAPSAGPHGAALSLSSRF